MKTKIIFALFIVVVIAVVSTTAYFISRPQQQELIPPKFAQLPEKPKLIDEFNYGPSIYSVAFSPSDQNLIASVDQNGTIKLWDRNNTIDPVKILSHPGQFAHIGFSPTGELLASAGFGTLILWDVASGNKINTLDTSRNEFAFSPDGNQLATVRNGAKLWDIRNPKQIREIGTLPFDEAHKIGSWACAVTISTDGKLIAAGYANGDVNVWDLRTKQHVRLLRSPFIKMGYLKFSPKNNYLVSGDQEFKMMNPGGYIMWKLPSWQRYGEVQRGHIENLVFSPDEKVCVGANQMSFSGRGVELWSVENGAPITSIPTEARDVSFTQDGSLLVSGNQDGVIQVWQLNYQQLALATPPADVVRIVYFLPKDKEPFPNITEKLDKSIREVQDFYADEMERHGFGRKTFNFETDENGKAKIYLGKYYQTNTVLPNGIWLSIIDDISGTFQPVLQLYNVMSRFHTFRYTSNDAYSTKDNVWRGYIEGIAPGKNVQVFVKSLDRESVAYVLRGVFGVPYVQSEYERNSLKRLFSHINNKMPWGKQWTKLSRCEAEWLDRSRFFNPNQPFFDKAPKMDMRVSVPKDSGLRHFTFEVADEDGMHQVQLFVPIDIKNQRWRKKFHDCQALNGKEKATVAFEITYPEIKIVKLRMIDMHGNIASRKFSITEKTPEPSEKP